MLSIYTEKKRSSNIFSEDPLMSLWEIHLRRNNLREKGETIFRDESE